MLVQRCTVHKHRNLLAHAPDRLHEEISADYNDMIYADSKPEIEWKRKAFIRKWRLKCRAVATKQGARFRKGQSGNPSGRPRGARNKAGDRVEAQSVHPQMAVKMSRCRHETGRALSQRPKRKPERDAARRPQQDDTGGGGATRRRGGGINAKSHRTRT
jgi:Family of unknown function (DUF5681)